MKHYFIACFRQLVICFLFLYLKQILSFWHISFKKCSLLCCWEKEKRERKKKRCYFCLYCIIWHCYLNSNSSHCCLSLIAFGWLAEDVIWDNLVIWLHIKPKTEKKSSTTERLRVFFRWIKLFFFHGNFLSLSKD